MCDKSEHVTPCHGLRAPSRCSRARRSEQKAHRYHGAHHNDKSSIDEKKRKTTLAQYSTGRFFEVHQSSTHTIGRDSKVARPLPFKTAQMANG
jgi:hypothetical protein